MKTNLGLIFNFQYSIYDNANFYFVSISMWRIYILILNGFRLEAESLRFNSFLINQNMFQKPRYSSTFNAPSIIFHAQHHYTLTLRAVGFSYIGVGETNCSQGSIH